VYWTLTTQTPVGRPEKNINYFEKPLEIPRLKTKKKSMKRKERNNNWSSLHNSKEKNCSSFKRTEIVPSSD